MAGLNSKPNRRHRGTDTAKGAAENAIELSDVTSEASAEEVIREGPYDLVEIGTLKSVMDDEIVKVCVQCGLGHAVFSKRSCICLSLGTLSNSLLHSLSFFLSVLVPTIFWVSPVVVSLFSVSSFLCFPARACTLSLPLYLSQLWNSDVYWIIDC
jgi:hypothetical protein